MGADTPATGKPFSFNGVTFMRVKNGKIVTQSDYDDGLGFQKQLGWIQQPSRRFRSTQLHRDLCLDQGTRWLFRRSEWSGALLETGLSTSRPMK